MLCVENGVVLIFGLASDLGFRISDFPPSCSGHSVSDLPGMWEAPQVPNSEGRSQSGRYMIVPTGRFGA